MLNEIDAETFARRKKKADYMREYGRRLGAVPCKGETFTCEVCGSETPRSHGQQRWCPGCKPEGLRLYKKGKRLEAGHVAIGTQMKCRTCDGPIIKEYKRQFHCSKCSELNRLEKLPHQEENRRKRAAEFVRNRRRKYPKWAIHGRMSAGISQSLRDGKNGRSWESLVGYTVEDLMLHLERQFLPGMTWENRSLWQIDHRQPLAGFSFSTAEDDEFMAAWSLTNLQPLWAKDNLKKSALRTLLC